MENVDIKTILFLALVVMIAFSFISMLINRLPYIILVIAIMFIINLTKQKHKVVNTNTVIETINNIESKDFDLSKPKKK